MCWDAADDGPLPPQSTTNRRVLGSRFLTSKSEKKKASQKKMWEMYNTQVADVAGTASTSPGLQAPWPGLPVAVPIYHLPSTHTQTRSAPHTAGRMLQRSDKSLQCISHT